MPKAFGPEFQARKEELEMDLIAAAKFWDAISEAFQDTEGGDLEHEVFADAAVACGLLDQVPYDPEKHLDVYGEPEEGDMIWVTTERARRLSARAR